MVLVELSVGVATEDLQDPNEALAVHERGCHQGSDGSVARNSIALRESWIVGGQEKWFTVIAHFADDSSTFRLTGSGRPGGIESRLLYQ
jgi:hypothetical protein